MGEDLYYATGQAARELGATQEAIRALCQGGLIEAEITPGKQFRIRASELERLRREGLPQTPRPMPGESRAREGGGGAHGGDDPRALSASSPDVIEAYAAVRRKEARLQ